MKRKVVAVEWVDAIFDPDEQRTTFSTPPNVVTYGVLLANNEDYVRVAGEAFEDGSYRATTTIPKGMVRAVRRLR